MHDDRTDIVGFIGLGKMGRPMAHNLAAAGTALVVYDISASATSSFLADHPQAHPATSPADFSETDVVVTMLPSGVDVQQALLNWDGGIGAHLPRGALVVEMSSARPSDTLHLQDALAHRGVRVIDAPVSGGVPRAITGELTIMVGGESDDIERAQGVLRILGDRDRQFRIGRLGSGHAMKALNNYLGGAAYIAATEALTIGKRMGLEPSTMLEVINVSSGRSFNSEMVLAPHVITGEYGTGFAAGLLAKDVHIAASIAQSIDFSAPLLAVSDELWTKAADVMDADADHSMAHRVWYPEDIDLAGED
jgi:3-hydroxyisobutyrate dehydrogenase